MHPPKKKISDHTPHRKSWPYHDHFNGSHATSQALWEQQLVSPSACGGNFPVREKKPIQAIQGIKGEIAEIQELEQLGNFGAEWNSRAPPAYGIGFGCPAVRRCSGRGERNAGVGSTGIWTFTRFWVVIQQHSSRWLMVIYLVCNVEVLCYYITWYLIPEWNGTMKIS